MESITTNTKQWTESDGTVVTETITTKRVTPGIKGSCPISAQQKSKIEPKTDTGSSTKGGAMAKNDLEKQALDQHNMYRAKHGCPKLSLSRELCDYAQEWANHLANIGRMQHRSNNKYGENIFYKGGTRVTVDGNEPVDAWYNEIHQYNFNNPGFSSGTGHFTQVVWRDSKQMGIGFAQKGSSIYVVANYDPPGNYQGRFKENVPRPN